MHQNKTRQSFDWRVNWSHLIHPVCGTFVCIAQSHRRSRFVTGLSDTYTLGNEEH